MHKLSKELGLFASIAYFRGYILVRQSVDSSRIVCYFLYAVFINANFK